ncbi:Uncharacterised protein [Serratia quinivorans]|uniref:Uncharacterized protein n=1 Tax=Serratia quinivorans TaxID=137545 RepID=A0A380AVW3_9GAMM|nr:hypothetical protein [Serratia proteamaculans]RYM60183.1 hypothetical protein BSR03_17215 [Serratia proteamaculans]SUI88285.1 Uncharacterised protein [Serratia quinivorans]
MSTSDESRQQLKLLRVIGFGGLVTVIATAVAIAQYQEKNQLNIDYLRSQLDDVQLQLRELNAIDNDLRVIRYQTEDNTRRIAKMEEKTDAH